MALGDFEVTAAFEENEYVLLFWLIFLVGSLIALLILLNMVIAVMSAAFERVEEDNIAHCYRSKLEVVLENLYRMPRKYKQAINSCKYIVQVEVDPEVDPIVEEDSEARIRSDIDTLKEKIDSV